MTRERLPTLPAPRGPLTAALRAFLLGKEHDLSVAVPDESDPLADDDLQLALYECYELHYRGFRKVPAALEWDPRLLAFRAALERPFEEALGRIAAGPPCEPAELGATLFDLAEADTPPSLAEYLEVRGSLEQFREFVAHRSAYQLKEADPHSWAIPRLEGAVKSALLEVQTDEYGSGNPDRMHSQLFANSMAALDLDPTYGAYVHALPGSTLATVNLISLFGLHRRLRGALVGHLATFEITSPVPNGRYANALRRLGFGREATEFYDEHVEADSVHENIAAYDLAQGLAQTEPETTGDILFGARALLALDGAMASSILAAWDAGTTSLRSTAPATVAA